MGNSQKFLRFFPNIFTVFPKHFYCLNGFKTRTKFIWGALDFSKLFRENFYPQQGKKSGKFLARKIEINLVAQTLYYLRYTNYFSMAMIFIFSNFFSIFIVIIGYWVVFFVFLKKKLIQKVVFFNFSKLFCVNRTEVFLERHVT